MPGGKCKIVGADGKASQWKKGQSGNNKGRPPKLPDLDILMAELLGEEKAGMTEAKRLLQKIKTMAFKNNLRAAEVLLERGYGKVKQPLEHTGKDGSPLNIIFHLDKDSAPLNDE